MAHKVHDEDGSSDRATIAEGVTRILFSEAAPSIEPISSIQPDEVLPFP